MKQQVTICWFRRDLRLTDNAALYYALKNHKNVLPIFIFDTNILDKLSDKKDARVQFIYDTITNIQQQLKATKSSLHVLYTTPQKAFNELLHTYQIDAVYTNHDYEKYGIERDAAINNLLKQHNIPFHTYKDQVIFEKDEVVKDEGKPYTVFTPYSKKWKATLTSYQFKPYPNEKYFSNFLKINPIDVPTLHDMGFEKSTINYPPTEVADTLIKHYQIQRDFPAVAGTSHLGIHLRFGTISIRQLAAHAQSLSETFLNELIWRDFYHMITWHFPYINEGKAFKPAYDKIQWSNNMNDFEKWCAGQTGYPIVDAGMRELNSTGFMHNRVRMITASFLCKHLLIDWRLGEAYFASKLLDFDFAANNGGWQWAAGSGCDAAPYFRIFNPYLQTKKFDADLKYIRKWVPEFEGFNYVPPIVEHTFARDRCLATYKAALGNT
ncbi:cryptochrome/photolyase family protein [Ferruginibacter yonginensis]|uniref:Cryptochrome/photolyase family protein n=1 Tax=Ferruginibacter yonginensis TaxID=1310416 RepID=A0ABV8QPS7_9BACT